MKDDGSVMKDEKQQAEPRQDSQQSDQETPKTPSKGRGKTFAGRGVEKKG